jgi:hypothetical protein
LNQAAIEAGRHTCGREVISLSVGTAFCPEDGYDVEALLAEADRRMYSVKQTHHAQGGRRRTLAQGASGNRCLRWKIAGHALALVATVLLGGLLSATLVRLAPGFDADERNWIRT